MTLVFIVWSLFHCTWRAWEAGYILVLQYRSTLHPIIEEWDYKAKCYVYIHRDTVIDSVSYDFLSFFIVRDRRLYSTEWDVFRRSRDLLRLHNIPSLWEWVKTMTGGMSLWTCTRSPPTNTNNLVLNWTHTVVTVMQQCLVCKFAKTINSTWLYIHKDYTKILYHPHAIRCLQ